MKNRKSKIVFLALGPALFVLSLILITGVEFKVRVALGTVLWMAVWWVTMPVAPGVTAFIPVVVNAIFSVTEMSGVISSYASELVFLLAGANLITMVWEKTGVDKRIAAYSLRLVGTSVRSQIIAWFILATLMSAVLPNTVVVAVLCSIAMSMLKYVGEGDLDRSSVSPLVLLAIVWGANNGGVLTPLGGSMNLVTVSHLENYTGSELLYTDWVVRILPFGIVVTLVTLVFLLLIKTDKKQLSGSREYFRELCAGFPKLSLAGKLSLAAFIVSAVLSFTRQLYQGALPGLKPGYVFLLFGMCMFFLKDDEGQPVLTWKYAESHMMWGMFFIFAGGTALGALVNGSGAAEVFAELISGIDVSNQFVIILVIVIFNTILSDVVNNTTCAAVMTPIVISIAEGLNLPVIPYVWIATVSYNMSYSLPTSIRAIPIGYGLNPGYMFKKGILVSVAAILAVSVLGYLLVLYWPAFGVLS